MGKLIMIGQMDNSDGTLEKDNRIYDVEGCSPTITCGGGSTQGKIMMRIKQATKKGYVECCEGGLADLSYPNSKTRRGRVQNGGTICPTITTESEIYKMCYRIRKLTPMECWRLMDFKDKDFIKSAAVNSNVQLYKQAGNSIVVNVLVAIIGQMIEGKEDMYKERI